MLLPGSGKEGRLEGKRNASRRKISHFRPGEGAPSRSPNLGPGGGDSRKGKKRFWLIVGRALWEEGNKGLPRVSGRVAGRGEGRKVHQGKRGFGVLIELSAGEIKRATNPAPCYEGGEPARLKFWGGEKCSEGTLQGSNRSDSPPGEGGKKRTCPKRKQHNNGEKKRGWGGSPGEGRGWGFGIFNQPRKPFKRNKTMARPTASYQGRPGGGARMEGTLTSRGSSKNGRLPFCGGRGLASPKRKRKFRYKKRNNAKAVPEAHDAPRRSLPTRERRNFLREASSREKKYISAKGRTML